jgi:hypothetical protein
MSVNKQFGLAVALLWAVPSLLHAQRAGGAGMGAPARRAVAATPALGGQTHRSFSGVALIPPASKPYAASHPRAVRVSPRHAPSVSANSLGLGEAPLSVPGILNPLPGFGFQFSHLNIIHSEGGIKAVIDPATQWQLAETERRTRKTPSFPGFWILGGGGYVVPPEPAEEEGEPQTQQQPPPESNVLPQAPATEESAEPSEPPLTTSAEPPDEGQFTLVLRSGTKIQAVAFTRANDKIIYITPEGTRQTMAASDLDPDATLRVNQERGPTLQLPH